ncbi:MAG: hypothetical protein KGY75_07735 [Candidatus Cloacimonetes bacterium]|nr:hypothetical protein [Candidatus Cloacimonadota bacterium]
MKPISEMTQGELAAFIDTHLRDKGIQFILSGGACVAIYSKHQYVSKDLDFIAQFSFDQKKIESAMKEICFIKTGRYYSHPNTPYYIDFISGPPSVGRETILKVNELSFKTGILRILSPTDAVKDRLAAFYHWGDRQSLNQAILVAVSNKIDLKKVKEWSLREGKKEKFDEFKRRLE